MMIPKKYDGSTKMDIQKEEVYYKEHSLLYYIHGQAKVFIFNNLEVRTIYFNYFLLNMAKFNQFVIHKMLIYILLLKNGKLINLIHCQPLHRFFFKSNKF